MVTNQPTNRVNPEKRHFIPSIRHCLRGTHAGPCWPNPLCRPAETGRTSRARIPACGTAPAEFQAGVFAIEACHEMIEPRNDRVSNEFQMTEFRTEFRMTEFRTEFRPFHRGISGTKLDGIPDTKFAIADHAADNRRPRRGNFYRERYTRKPYCRPCRGQSRGDQVGRATRETHIADHAAGNREGLSLTVEMTTARACHKRWN